MNTTIAMADSLIPEEIFHAAQLSTVRLSDLVDGRGGESFFPSRSCTYCRAAERLATRRSLPFHGAVFANGCTAMEKLYEVFARKSELSLVTLLDTPKINGERAIQFYSQRLEQLAKTLASTFGVSVDDSTLAESIRLNDAFRDGLRRRGQSRSRELGGKALSLASLPDQIRKLTDVEVREPAEAPRLLIAGTHLREDEWRAAIEAEGGIAAYFLTDHGDSYSRIRINPANEGNLYKALARAYLTTTRTSFGRLPSVMTDPQTLAATVREHRIQGIVLTQYSFCAKAGYESAWLKANSDLTEVPILRLELERTESVDAQSRTRIAAFLEMLRK